MNDFGKYIGSIRLLADFRAAMAGAYADILDFASRFKKRYDEEKLKLPYHLNLIDELHINENGHSRILFRLLQYRDIDGKYVFLSSLIDQFSKLQPSFGSIVIDKPRITQEKERIDLWVRDKSYAIIFENKVYDAADQETQLSRYIDKTMNDRELPQEPKRIFIVYMPQYPSEPSPQSWGAYQERFKDRYVNFSFFNGVLPWLKSDVLPKIDRKDNYIATAIYQYVDYLEGLFSLRTIQKTMNMNLEKFISEQLSLDECRNGYEKYLRLKEQYEDCNSLMKKLWEMQECALKNYWRNETERHFPNIEFSDKSNYLGVNIDVAGERVYVHIDKESKFYCQAEFEYWHTIEDTFIKRMKNDGVLHQENYGSIWTYFDSEPSEALFRCFIETVRYIIDLRDASCNG